MSTHFFHSDMVGAPTNTNAAGSTLAIIDACLNTGFNVVAPLSASVTSEVMTLTYAAAHGYGDKVWIRLDGAPGGSITQRASVTSTTVLTIPAPGFVDGTVIGTLSTRVAPAGWERVFSDTNIGVFRSKVIGPGSTRFFYRFADTEAASNPRMLRGYEEMTDANTGIGPFPSEAQHPGNGWSILRGANTTTRQWCVVADARACYLFMTNDANNNIHSGFGFGDFMPYNSADTFNGFTLGSASSSFSLSANVTHYTPRAAAGTGTSASGAKQMLFANSGSLVYPSAIDGGTVFSRPLLVTQSSMPRGEWRGLMCCSHNPIAQATLQLWTVLSAVVGVSGRVLVAKDSFSSNNFCAAFPIDEDWP